MPSPSLPQKSPEFVFAPPDEALFEEVRDFLARSGSENGDISSSAPESDEDLDKY